MKFRRFGRTGWQVSEIGYGMWGMGGWTGSEDTESLASLQQLAQSKLPELRLSQELSPWLETRRRNVETM